MVISAVPFFKAVTIPLLTVATLSSELSHFKLLVKALSGVILYSNCLVSPTGIFTNFSLNSILSIGINTWVLTASSTTLTTISSLY